MTDLQQADIERATRMTKIVFDAVARLTDFVTEGGDLQDVRLVLAFKDSTTCPACGAAWSAYEDRCGDPNCYKRLRGNR